MAMSQVEAATASMDRGRWLFAIVLVIAAVAGFYLAAAYGVFVQWAILLVGLSLAAAVFCVSEPGRRLIAFGRDAVKELEKVHWPVRKEAMQMTAYVFVFAVTMAIFLWLTDKTLGWVLYDLILGWRD